MTPRSKQITSPFWLLISLWSGAILVLFLCDCWHLGQTIKEIALIEARAYLNKDQALRLWAASHGGVYVPVSKRTPPNPYLVNVPERDIRTPQGQQLTLMNPAYMIRQVMSEYAQRYHVRGHITSLKFFRHETAPDEWERAALKAFETGSREVKEFTAEQGRPHLRIMRPLITEAPCLKCHGAQGYKVGDIRGGVSLSLPLMPYLDPRRKEIAAHAVSFGLLWLLGSAGFWMVASKLSCVIKRHDEAEARLRIANDNNQAFLENALTGIYIKQDDTIKFGNAKFVEIHGYSLEEMIGMSAIELIHPEDRAFLVWLHEQRMAGGNLPEEYEVRCITADSRTIWVQRRNTMIDYEGQPAVLGNEIDITLRKQAEEELKASEAQLKRVVARLVQHQEVERKSIALEIHEEIAQSLSAVKMSLEGALADEAEACGAGSQVMPSVIRHINETIDLIRRLTRRLSPIMLDDLGIKTSITALCRESAQTGADEIIPHMDIAEGQIPGDLKIVIYRVLEELLTLTASAGRESRRTVSLDDHNGRITMVFRQVGLQAAQHIQKPEWEMGMAIIKNRAESFGGLLTIASGEEHQLTIMVQWPLQAAGDE